ncbi:MAG: ComF family protein [Candidatus Cloacimonetes bacterium]|nr:ComF family protein [Candidatus Cloacimonadota bacterium]MDD3144060.1 ComF family protein [Candidatus Cloacimonadota bacterium]MDY0366362.1 ComF family protein [Candidatus Syntrophosphaera sp.]HPH60866.1 ComF family protein [Candidatus Syntrophosphaera sp.]
MRWNAILGSVDKLLFPPVCLACNSPVDTAADVLCAECRERLLPIRENYCDKCGAPLENYRCEACSHLAYEFDYARSAFVFKAPVQELVHHLKYDALRSPAVFFSQALLSMPASKRFRGNFDLVTAVPLHRVRERERGYNQSELLGRALAFELGIPFAQPVLRHQNTRSQTNLSRQARLDNLSGAFALRRNADVAGKRIIVVDDVFTTGTTVNEVSHVLKAGGASRVAVLTATRAV